MTSTLPDSYKGLCCWLKIDSGWPDSCAVSARILCRVPCLSTLVDNNRWNC